jgi:hypothetical protein
MIIYTLENGYSNELILWCCVVFIQSSVVLLCFIISVYQDKKEWNSYPRTRNAYKNSYIRHQKIRDFNFTLSICVNISGVHSNKQ